MNKKRFSAVGEWDGPEETLHPEVDHIQDAINALTSKGIIAYYGRADDPGDEPIPPPPVTYARPNSMCGVHITTGPRTGYGDFLRGCNRSISIQSVEDFGALQEAKEIQPKTVTVIRIYPKDNEGDDTPPGNWEWDVSQTKAIALDWMARCYPVLDINTFKPDYVGVINEPDPANSEAMKRADDFMLYTMQDAEAHGIKLAIWAWTAGLPRTPRIYLGDFAQAEASLTSVRYAGKHGHCLSMHDGSVDGSRPLFYQAYESKTALRYRVYKEFADEQGWNMPPIVITEAYQQNFYRNPDWGDLAWYLGELAKDAYVMGACLFTLGNYGDQNISAQLADLTDFVAAIPPIE